MLESASLTDWLQYISKKHTQKIAMELERVALVAKRLKLLSFKVPIVHVAGTNGKGTCTHALGAIYHQAGYKVGRLISPHLHLVNERICIDEKMISDADLVAALVEIEAARQATPLTYFEFLTLAALWLFREMQVDVILLEVGLGGRLDATNIVQSTVGVITSIGLDHQDWLGDTVQAIAKEKAGIVKSGMRGLVMGDIQAADVVIEFCRKEQVPCFRLGHDFSWPVPPSPYLASNLACALQAVDLLQDCLPVSAQDISKGLACLEVPGRLVWRHLPQLTLVDVAHNVDSVRVLAETLQPHIEGKQCVAIFAMLKRKDCHQVLAVMRDLVDFWLLPLLPDADTYAPENIGQILSEMDIHSHQCFANMEGALEVINSGVFQDAVVVVFGSFRTVSALDKALLAMEGVE